MSGLSRKHEFNTSFFLTKKIFFVKKVFLRKGAQRDATETGDSL